jgi:hypothetical protein
VTNRAAYQFGCCYVWIDHPKLGVRISKGAYGCHERAFSGLFSGGRMHWLNEYGKCMTGYAWKSPRGIIMISMLFNDTDGRKASDQVPPHVRAEIARKLKGRISKRMMAYV